MEYLIMGFGTRPNVINWSQPLGEGGRARARPLGGVGYPLYLGFTWALLGTPLVLLEEPQVLLA